MTRRRLAVDLCTYTQDQSHNASPYCVRKAAFTVGPHRDLAGVSDFHRVCLAHVGHAVEILTADGEGTIKVTADHERDGGFTDQDDPNGAT